MLWATILGLLKLERSDNIEPMYLILGRIYNVCIRAGGVSAIGEGCRRWVRGERDFAIGYLIENPRGNINE